MGDFDGWVCGKERFVFLLWLLVVLALALVLQCWWSDQNKVEQGERRREAFQEGLME